MKVRISTLFFILGAIMIGTILLILLIPLADSVQGSKGLTVKVYFKYSEWQKNNPEKIGKLYLNWYDSSKDDDNGGKILKSSFMAELPKKVVIKDFKVSVLEEFTILLSSFKRDDGNSVTGINSIEKIPEKVRILVP